MLAQYFELNKDLENQTALHYNNVNIYANDF